MFDKNRYAINYIHQAQIKPVLEHPSIERAGDNIDALNAIFEAHKAGGVEAVRKAWSVLKKAVPHLNRKQKLINFNDLHLIPRPEYALKSSVDGEAPNYAIYLRGLNALYGQPGSGKSFVAIDFCKRLALAYPDNAVIFSAGEGSSGLSGRSEAWNKHFQVATENMFLWDEAVPVLNPEAVEEFVANVEDLRPIFIVIDTLARSMAGENENDTSIMSKYITCCEDLMRRLDCGILLVHHTGRGGYIRGSSVLDGACDSMLKLQSSDDIITVFNSLDNGGKNKHNPEVPAVRLQILPVNVRVNEELINEAVVILSDKIIDDVVETLSDNQRLIIEFIFDIGEPAKASQIIESSDMAKKTVYRNLNKLVQSEFLKKDEKTAKYDLTDKGLKALGI